jgi:hypothetical protein
MNNHTILINLFFVPNILFAYVPQLQPKLIIEGSMIYIIDIYNDNIKIETSNSWPQDSREKDNGLAVYLNNKWLTISEADRALSMKWLKANSQKYRLSIQKGNLYLDGNLIDLNGVTTTQIWQAIPWKNGLLCHGRTYRKGLGQSIHNLGDLLTIPAEDIEPCCILWVNPKTKRGVSRYLYGKNPKNLIVFPIPSQTKSSR